jgi:hypothetical protein
MQLQSLSLARPSPRRVVRIPLPAPRGASCEPSVVPKLWGFYQHRKAGYITQVVSWIPHRGVGLLVQVHQFHRQFPQTMTFNPELFDRLFEAADV